MLLYYENNVFCIGKLHLYTTSTASHFKKQVQLLTRSLVALIVSIDACMRGVQGSNLADGQMVLKRTTTFIALEFFDKVFSKGLGLNAQSPI